MQGPLRKKSILKTILAASSNKPHLIAITETWLDGSVTDFDFENKKTLAHARASGSYQAF